MLRRPFTAPLPFPGIASTGQRPATEFDLTSGTLDPRITFVRAVNPASATYFDKTGTMVIASNNYIRNSTMQGVAVGSPGTMPTDWLQTTGANLNTSIVATGTEGGMPYVDIRFQSASAVGTATALSFTGLQIGSNGAIPASNGQVWSGGVNVKLVGGSFTNITAMMLAHAQYTSGAGFVAQNLSSNIVPTTADLSSQRYTYTSTLAGGGTVACVAFTYRFTYTTGVAIDVTLRFAAPNMDLSATAGAWVPTNGSATSGQPRYDYGPVSTSAVTNWIRNSTNVGCIPASSILPTNWIVNSIGLAQQIINAGTDENGLPFIDIRLFGTTTAQFGNIIFETAQSIPACNAQTWTCSASLALVGGAFTNIQQYGLFARDNTSGGSFIANPLLTPLTITSTLTRYSSTGTISDNTCAYLQPGFYFNMSAASGQTADFTVRIAAVQLQRGSFASPFIPTSGAVATYNAVCKGLLFEEGRTNSIKNSTNVGAASGSPGTLPTGWTSSLGGLTQTIVGTGVENGLNYIDVRFNGTTTAVAFNLNFGATTDVAAANGQTWTMSFYMKLTAGSLANVTSLQMIQQLYDSTPAFLIAGQYTITPVTGVPLAQSRFVYTYPIATANTAWNYPYIKFNCASGVAIDVTLRLACVQLEQGAFATSFIPSTNAAVTRSGDSATSGLTPWFNQTAGAFWAEFLPNQAAATGTQAGIIRWDDGTNTNDAVIFISNTANVILASTVATVLQINGSPSPSAPTYGGINRAALTYGDTVWRAGLNGATVSGTGGAVYGSNNRLMMGASNINPASWELNGWMRRVRYYNKFQTAASLAKITGLGVGEGQTLDIDFTTPDGQTNPNLVFSRASVGTYFDASGIMRTAAANVPRYDYNPLTLNARGYLAEEQRTNIFLQSATFTTSSQSNVTFTTSSIMALDGVTPMVRCADNSTSANHYSQQGFTVTASSTMTLSYFVKAETCRYVQLFYDDNTNGCFATYDLVAGTSTGLQVRGTGTATAATITSYGGGLYRITLTGVAAAATTVRGGIILDPSGNTSFAPGYVGSGSSVLMWGGQLEAGAAVSSYIATTSASVTRQADIMLAYATGFAIQQQGTLVVDAHILNLPNKACTLLGMSGLTGTKTSINISGGNAVAIFDATGGLNVSMTTMPTTTFRAGFAYSNGTQRGAMQGANAVSGAVTPLSATYQLIIGTDGIVQQPTGYIRRVRYFPRVMTAAELATITT